jgi:hypothetical protein
LREFEQLYRALKDFAGPPRPTESVHLDAVRKPAAAIIRGGVVLSLQDLYMPQHLRIDLGELRKWAVNSGKTYDATRFFTSGEKTLTLRLGRRATASRVRLGYRIRISGQILDITDWETAPPGEAADAIDWFPSQSYEIPLTLQTKVYDCVQLRALSVAEEESFDETGDAGRARRVLINERNATVNLKLRVEFTPLAGGDNKAHLGEVRLTFTPEHPLDQPHAYLLDIDVLETHVKSTHPPALEEVTVEGLSLHIVPSWLRVGAEFFDDYDDALQRMLQAMLGVALGKRHQQSLQPGDIPQYVDPTPKYLTVRDAATVALASRMFETANRDSVISAELLRYQVPQAIDGTRAALAIRTGAGSTPAPACEAPGRRDDGLPD